MMNLYRRNSRGVREHRRGRTALVSVTVIVCAVIAVDLLLGGRIRAIARGTIAPVTTSMHAGVTLIFGNDFWRSRMVLLNELSSLRGELAKQQGQSAGFQALKLENDSLREMAKLVEIEAGVTAPVISSFRSSPYGTFLIGAGREAGVVPGCIVMTDGGFVLGTVTDTTARTATVRAALAPMASLEVLVGSAGFTLKGYGGGNGRAEVSREAELNQGDAVLASVFANRPIGIIGHLESASSSAYSDVYVVFPMNLSDIRYVHVIPPIQ